MYRPRNKYEAEAFPNLGTAKVTGGIPRYIGMTGTIIKEDDKVVRIAFDHFWDRPDGMSAEEADDATYCFKGEYEKIIE